MTARAPADRDDSGDFLRVREIFESALDRPPQERMAFVEAACGGDALLLAAVQEMLRADAEPHPLLDSGRASPPSDGDPAIPSRDTIASSRCWDVAGWARCTGRTTRRSAGTSP